MSRNLLILFVLSLATSVGVAQDVEVNAGKWSVTVNETSGIADIVYDGKVLINNNEAEWGVEDDRQAFSTLSDIKIEQQPLNDAFGSGTMLAVSGTADNARTTVTHTYYIYSNRDYILTDVKLTSNSELAINKIAPVRSSSTTQILDAGSNLHLSVPFDNDEWVRYETSKFGRTHRSSYEVSALFNNDSRQGFVVGSITHDMWKTGIEITTKAEDKMTSISICNGAASKAGTRDDDPHGTVRGNEVSSSKIMIGYFADWRRGMETYADLCATVHPRLPFAGAKPFGWNSWGVIQQKITRKQAVDVSDFFADSLQSVGFHTEDNVVYIGLDSYWDNFNMRDHTAFVRNCRENGQKAGLYWSPFVDWGNWADGTLPDGSKHADAWLRDSNGNPLKRTGATAFDPTHPGTQARIKRQLEQFIDWGYEYIKLDFMIHGILEGVHYDKNVYTGVQAYNVGMNYIKEIIGDKMFINLSIAPLFPAHQAHSRRIACDAYASLNNSEYTLNSTAYSWWLDHCYTYNDADNVVMKGHEEYINRVRFTSSYITGIVILGDELTDNGDAGAKERVHKLASNNELVQMAYQTKAFYPVDAIEGNNSPNFFMYTVADTTYLAGLNFTGRRLKANLDFDRLGLTTGTEYVVRELWTGDEVVASETYEIIVPRSDAVVYKIYPKPIGGSVDILPYDATRCYYDAYMGEVRTKSVSHMIESYVYAIGGACVATMQGAHDAVDVKALPTGVYLYRGLDANGNSVTYKFTK